MLCAKIILALYVLLWLVVLARSLRRRNARPVGRCMIYHALTIGAAFMVLPFYWMVSTSLQDFQSANQTPPTWLPLGTSYFAPPPPGGIVEKQETEAPKPSVTSGGKSAIRNPQTKIQNPQEIEVGLLSDAALPWKEIREKEEVKVAPVDQLNEEGAHYIVKGSQLRRVRRPHWENYVEAWNSPAKSNPENPITFIRYFYVSIVTSVLTTIGTLFTSILAAYAFAKMRFKGRGIFFLVVLATMMVPSQVLIIPDFLILARLPDYTFGMHWLDNFPALIVPWLASVFSIFLLRQFFIGIPDDLWDAAQIDGAGRFRYLWQVMVPLSKPALITAGIFVFLGEWNSLLWPLIVTTSPEMRTLMVGLQNFNEEMRGNFHLLMAASTIAIMPVVILFFFLQRFFVEGIARTGMQ